AVHIPDSGSNTTDAQHQASLNLIQIADLLPRAADDVVKWSYDDGAVKSITDALNPGGTLQQARQGLTQIDGMVTTILSDCEKDIAWAENRSQESNQDIFNRKIALLQSTIIPGLQTGDSMLSSLISYQQTSIAQAQPTTGDLWKLYDAKTTLQKQTVSL